MVLVSLGKQCPYCGKTILSDAEKDTAAMFERIEIVKGYGRTPWVVRVHESSSDPALRGWILDAFASRQQALDFCDDPNGDRFVGKNGTPLNLVRVCGVPRTANEPR